MKAIWQVEDGYVGKSRPQETIIPDSELAECNNEEERQKWIYDYIQEDFENRISWTLIRTEEE